jgi:hypothetical protein
MIPLYDRITIQKTLAEDDWNIPTDNESISYKCLIEYSSEKITDANGSEIVASGSIMLKGLVNVSYMDNLTWTDQLGNVYKRMPKRIEPINYAGKTLFTKVYF